MALAIVRSGSRKRSSSLTVHVNTRQPECCVGNGLLMRFPKMDKARLRIIGIFRYIPTNTLRTYLLPLKPCAAVAARDQSHPLNSCLRFWEKIEYN